MCKGNLTAALNIGRYKGTEPSGGFAMFSLGCGILAPQNRKYEYLCQLCRKWLLITIAWLKTLLQERFGRCR